jgi:hypothetical protein
LIKDVLNIIKWDVDSLNGELFLKLTLMDVLLNKPFMKMLGDLPDMLLFAKRMDLFLLLNLKSYLMETIALMFLKPSLKELTKLSSKLWEIIKFS